MRWKIGQFVFCEVQQTLTKGHNTEQLEPILVELLAHFCRHPNETFSRSQLIEHVWAGRVITDNAVTKVITKLRKHFNDDAKAPRYISTLPKRGYRFIALAEVLDESPSVTQETTEQPNLALASNIEMSTKPRLDKIKITMAVFFVVLVSVLANTFLLNNTSSAPSFTGVKAITRDPGVESKPQVSPNQRYLAYTEYRKNKMRLWVKSLEDETSIEISHGDDNSIWVDSASWNSDGSQLVYLVTTPQSCQYFIRDFNALTVGEPRLIHNCPADSYGKIAFTHDDSRLIYTESAKRGAGFELFELNLTTGNKRRLNQPPVVLGGNSQFDLHPTENKLVISSPDEQQWEGFYSLNLDTDELVLLFKQDAYICCGRWDHTGERIILMGKHPATQLVSYNLKGKDRTVLYDGSEQVKVPERHTNGKDYIFPMMQFNMNSYLYNFESTQAVVIANSSVDDKLAVFAHHDELIAYVSLSSGSEQIWLTNYDGSYRKRVTNIDIGQRYIELGWSPSGEHIFALTLNEIHLINTKTGDVSVLKIPQIEIRGVSWKDDQTIAYSINDSDQWRVHYYDIKSNQAIAAAGKWQYISYHPNPENTLWFSADNKLFAGSNKTPVTKKEFDDRLFLYGRVFNLKKFGSKWAWNEYSAGKYQLLLKDGIDNPPMELLHSDSFHFNLSSQGVVFHQSETLNSDIYQTTSK